MTAAAKVALVTGSSRGIGAAIALRLATDGHAVFVNGRTERDVSAVCGAIAATGGRAYPLIADLGDDAAAAAAVHSAFERAGRLDALVLNLGSGRTPNDASPSPAETRRVFDLNFFSSLATTHAALARMKPGASVTFVSSIAGCEAIGAPTAYAAAKTALLAYAKSLSRRPEHRGIRINSVSPGNVLFPGGTWDDKLKADEKSVRAMIEANVPMNGFASPDDIAAAVAYLVGAPFVTGHNLVVDGGQTRGTV